VTICIGKYISKNPHITNIWGKLVERIDRPLTPHPLQSGDGSDPLCRTEDGNFRLFWE